MWGDYCSICGQWMDFDLNNVNKAGDAHLECERHQAELADAYDDEPEEFWDE